MIIINSNINIIVLLILLLVSQGSSNYIEDINSINSENYIDNNCQFNIIRIKKNNILCNDYGIYKKFCNINILPEEFVIFKEKGVGYRNIYTIKPAAIYQETNNYKVKLARFYYTFKCNNLDNEPYLNVRIIPEIDNSFIQEIYQFIKILFTIILILFLVAIMLSITNCNIVYHPYYSNYILGYIIGLLLNSTQIIYCD